MKNETARREIESLDYYLQNHTDDYSEESHTAMMMAVKALEQQPCEDAISRQAVLDGLASIAKARAKSDAQKSLMGRVMFFTEHLPPVTPQPKTGHWIEHPKGIYAHLVCDKCLSNAPYDCRTNYCPNCGAKMESEG